MAQVKLSQLIEILKEAKLEIIKRQIKEKAS